SEFHLVGHDHGAVLGWTVAADERAKGRVLSYSALSVPHVDAFSEGLYGDGEDEDQVIASQYFSVFVMEDSASMNFNALYLTMGQTSGRRKEYGSLYSSPSDFQKALWWYNGAMDAGVMSMPRSMTAAELWGKGALAMSAMRAAFGGGGEDGAAAASPTGPISGVPVLYVCGGNDAYILCDHEYARRTREYVVGADYRNVVVGCGHAVLDEGDCENVAERDKVLDAIIGRIESV
ncbi:hypothetical protein TrRE_jg749, partial [Triparma retinervis]